MVHRKDWAPVVQIDFLLSFSILSIVDPVFMRTCIYCSIGAQETLTLRFGSLNHQIAGEQGDTNTINLFHDLPVRDFLPVVSVTDSVMPDAHG